MKVYTDLLRKLTTGLKSVGLICIALLASNLLFAQSYEIIYGDPRYMDSIKNIVSSTVDDRPQYRLKDSLDDGKWIVYSYALVLSSGGVYDSSKIIMIEATYANGLRNGDCIMYIGDRQIGLKSYYKNGLENGEFSSWYMNKKVRIKGFFRNGAKIGTWEYYSDDGRLIKEEFYKNNGRLSETIEH